MKKVLLLCSFGLLLSGCCWMGGSDCDDYGKAGCCGGKMSSCPMKTDAAGCSMNKDMPSTMAKDSAACPMKADTVACPKTAAEAAK